MSSGLPWIRLYRDLPNHPKLLELECTIGPSALAHVVKLWCAAASFYRDGLVKGSPAAIARLAGWGGDPDTFVRAIVDCGLFESATGGIQCHDWDAYQGAHIERMDAEAERQRGRRGGRTQRVRSTYAVRDADVRSTEPVRHAVRTHGRGEEIRGDKRREDHDHERAQNSDEQKPTEQQIDPSRALWATRPEPLGMHGEIPGDVGGVWGFKWRDFEVAHHLKLAAPDLDETARWDQTEDCLNYRFALSDREFRQWLWPQGCIPRLIAWLERANRTHLDGQTARARAARAGVHVTDMRRT